MRVIALKGRPNCGKTQTLTIVHSILIESGGVQVPNAYVDLGNEDFLDVLKFQDLRVGIVTQGDYAIRSNSVKNHLQKLKLCNCDVAICACTEGKTKEKIKEAIETFPCHTHIQKIPSDTIEFERTDNEKCAKTIVDIVINLQKTFPGNPADLTVQQDQS